MMNNKKAATLVDVARKAGVSVMTASRALNGEGYVAPETRAKLELVARELGYKANAIARRMKGARTNVVGVVVGDLTAMTISFITSISEEVRKNKLDLFVYNMSGAPSDALSKPIDQLMHGLWDGLLFILPNINDDYLHSLEKSSSPVVLLNYCKHDTTLPVVNADNANAARDAVTHLVGLGHRRIAFIKGTDNTGQSEAQERGYRSALGDAGLQYDPKLVQNGDYTEVSGLAAGRLLFALPDPPTAIFASNDAMAFGCYTAIREKGLRIPQDVSVIGFDDMPQVNAIQPCLTTLRPPFTAMAQAAVYELMLRIKDQPSEHPSTDFTNEFVVRGSTGPVPTTVAATSGRS